MNDVVDTNSYNNADGDHCNDNPNGLAVFRVGDVRVSWRSGRETQAENETHDEVTSSGSEQVSLLS